MLLRKIIYITCSVLLGFFLFMIFTVNVQMNHIAGLMQDAFEDSNYQKMNQIRRNLFHNPNPIASHHYEDKPQFVLFESASIYLETFDNQPSEERVAKTLTFILYNLGNEDISTINGENESRLSFYNNAELVFDFDLVSNTGNQMPNGRDFIRRNDRINLFHGYPNNIPFIHVHLDLVEFLNETSNITDVKFYNARGIEVFRTSVDFNLDSSFYGKIKDLESRLDYYRNAQNQEGFSEFLSDWIEDFEYEGYKRSLEPSQLFGFDVTVRIFLRVAIYVVVVAVIGYFIFRRKKEDVIDPRRAI